MYIRFKLKEIVWIKDVLIAGKFPFCEDDVSDEKNGTCAKWVKRQVEMKLDSKKGHEFNFSKVQK